MAAAALLPERLQAEGVTVVPEEEPSFGTRTNASFASDGSGSCQTLISKDAERALIASGPQLGSSEELLDLEAPHWSRRSARFVLAGLLHLANVALRVWALRIYYVGGAYHVVAAQVVFETLGALLSMQVVWTDADVRRWLRVTPCILRLPAALVALAILGCCQVIHVKRAWARQLKVAEVLSTIEDQDFLWSGPALGAEHALPVALITGVPFALVSCYGLLTTDHDKLCIIVLTFATLSALSVVSVAVVEVDTSVSAHVAKQYHLNTERRRRRHFQFLYPLSHVVYRTVEVIMRCMVLSLCIVLASADGVRGAMGAATICIVEYTIGVALLWWWSPAGERFIVHLLIGLGFLVADVAAFVDMPCFCRPARRISRAVEGWRVFSFLVFGALLTVTLLTASQDRVFREQRLLIIGLAILSGSTLAHYCLKLTPLWRHAGDDLHSAVLRRRHRRVQKLLGAGPGGEMLDVNGRTKDSQQATPAMLAAEVGDVDSLRHLVCAGARLHLRDSHGETCLHHAVQRGHVEAVAFLLSLRAGRAVLRQHGDALRDLAKNSSSLTKHEVDAEKRAKLLALLQPEARHPTQACVPSNFASVRADFCIGRQLDKFFPNAIREEVPPTQLHSVSSLILVHASGTLARLTLASRYYPTTRRDTSEQPPGQQQQQQSIDLDSLRFVKTLGQGVAGTVVEVEGVDERSCSSSSSGFLSQGPFFMRSPRRSYLPGSSSRSVGEPAENPPRRFAMKLQSKIQAHAQWQACSEILALKRVVHPFIVRLEHAFQTPRCFALLLELCPNGDLNHLLCTTRDSGGRLSGLPAERCVRYMGQVLLALVYLHEAGLVYRDLKPGNILLSAADEAKLADFGLSLRVGTSSRRKRLSVVGTPGFLAPELIFGDGDMDGLASLGTGDTVDPFKTDAYSFGITLEVALLGESVAEFCCDGSNDVTGSLLPRGGSDEDMAAVLEAAEKDGLLAPEARRLLGNLLQQRPMNRKALRDPAVRGHDFFCKTLRCQSLEEALMPRGAVDASL